LAFFLLENGYQFRFLKVPIIGTGPWGSLSEGRNTNSSLPCGTPPNPK
jgi:hypothetical protein